MKNKTILLLLLFLCNDAISQEVKVDGSYTYLYSNQWDKAVQTYNFSRPFISEKQPLLIHGVNSSLSYIFKSDKKVKHGLNVSYSYFRSFAKNENIANSLNLHFLNLGYILHFENKEKFKGLYADLIISATSSGLFRKVNGEPLVDDETTSKALGIGGDMSFKLGYSLKSEGNAFLSPFVSMAYTPYLFSPNSEAVLNQTKGLTSQNWTGIVSARVGLTFHMRAVK